MATASSSHYIVILCGGTGPRLWPLSRVDHPKQFLKLFSENSLLKDSFLRAQKIVPTQNIYIVTNEKYRLQVKKDLGTLVDSHHILAEPQKKNTAMAILYATAFIYQRDPHALIASFPSDHFVSPLKTFTKDINLAFSLAKNDGIVTLGIRPTNPNPAYGYIITNPKKDTKVDKFIEKPDALQAKKLIKKDNVFWNSGIYIFQIDQLLQEFKLHSPQYLPLFDRLIENLDRPRLIQKIYSLAPPLAIDKAISEKSSHLSMLPATFTWSDIGQWDSIYQRLPKKNSGIALLNPNSNFIELDSTNCLLSSSSNKLVALLDVQNLAVIDTPDALLICQLNQNSSFKVRELVGKIVQNLKIKHFFTGKND